MQPPRRHSSHSLKECYLYRGLFGYGSLLSPESCGGRGFAGTCPRCILVEAIRGIECLRVNFAMSYFGTASPNPWVLVLDALEKKVNRHSYETWLKPTRYSHASNKVLYVRVPTAEFRHVGDKYADLIQEAVDNLGLGYEDVKFVTAEDDPSNTPIRDRGAFGAQ